jgi:hypothetical protein
MHEMQLADWLRARFRVRCSRPIIVPSVGSRQSIFPANGPCFRFVYLVGTLLLPGNSIPALELLYSLGLGLMPSLVVDRHFAYKKGGGSWSFKRSDEIQNYVLYDASIILQQP